MNPISCIIVDDEPLARQVISEHIKDVGDLQILGEFSTVIEADKFISQQPVDIIFLDINMPKMTGLQWAQQLKNAPIIIFTTAYSEYALEAFEVEAFDYLLKPIAFDRFLKTCNRAKKYLDSLATKSEDQDWLTIKEGKRLYKLELKDIKYLKAFGDYVRIFSTEKVYITKERFNNIKKVLPGQFCRIHRSFIVNINHIDYLEGNHLCIMDMQKLPISDKYREEFLGIFKNNN